jgi:hypothetical protein
MTEKGPDKSGFFRRNPQLGIRRETVQNSRRFLVAALLGMTRDCKLLEMEMAVFGFFTTLSKGGLGRKFPGFRSVSTNADGRNQNVSRRDAETQRRKEIFLFFTVKIHPPHPDPLPPLGERG